jgi:hypothetical protein
VLFCNEAVHAIAKLDGETGETLKTYDLGPGGGGMLAEQNGKLYVGSPTADNQVVGNRGRPRSSCRSFFFGARRTRFRGRTEHPNRAIMYPLSVCDTLECASEPDADREDEGVRHIARQNELIAYVGRQIETRRQHDERHTG